MLHIAELVHFLRKKTVSPHVYTTLKNLPIYTGFTKENHSQNRLKFDFQNFSQKLF